MNSTEALTDWRMAKKAATRMRIREAALRLFSEQGYDETTVEQIAGEAGVTHTTFFRYFPTKEAVVLSDDYDPLIIDLIRNQPDERAPAEKLCEALLAGLSQIYAAQKQKLLQQMRLVLSVPVLRARLWENQLGNQQVILQAFDQEEQTFEVMVIISAVYAASTTAIIAWASNNGENELPELLAHAFAALRNL